MPLLVEDYLSLIGIMDAFCQSSTCFRPFTSCSDTYIIVLVPFRGVSLLLDIGFQKQSRMFFHPLTNSASTGLIQEQIVLSRFCSCSRMNAIEFYFSKCIFNLTGVFFVVSVQLLQQKIWTNF